MTVLELMEKLKQYEAEGKGDYKVTVYDTEERYYDDLMDAYLDDVHKELNIF